MYTPLNPLWLYVVQTHTKTVFLSLLEDWNNLEISTQKQHSREMFRQQITHIITSPSLCCRSSR